MALVSMKNIKHTLETLPPLTEAQVKELNRLSSRPDSEVDTSDISELSDSELAAAKRGGLCRPVKKQITARVDADVLAWLKSGGKGYQSRMNAILRQAMLNTK